MFVLIEFFRNCCYSDTIVWCFFSNPAGLLQLMACAQAGKSLAYCTFFDRMFDKRALKIFQALCDARCTVGEFGYMLKIKMVRL